METARFDVGDYVKINAVAGGVLNASAYKIDAVISINGNLYYILKGIYGIYSGEELTKALSTDVYSCEEKPLSEDDADKAIQRALHDQENGLGKYNVTLTKDAEKANGCKCAEAKDQSCDIKLANKAEKDIAKACNQLMVTLIKKNRDYGDSFGNTFRELGPITGLTRFLDKVNRIKNLTKEAGKHEVTDESLLDTWKDAAGYAILNYINLLPSKEVTDKNSQTTKDNT
jgi:hypothetical protein